VETFVLGLLDHLVEVSEKDNKADNSLEGQIFINDVDKSISSIKFMLDDNVDSQRILAWVMANAMTSGAITVEPKIIKTVYKYKLEEKLREVFFYDMYKHQYKYLRIIIETLTPEKVKNIMLEQKEYSKKIAKALIKAEEIKSTLISREIGLCLMI
jgi:hypothetical protein